MVRTICIGLSVLLSPHFDYTIEAEFDPIVNVHFKGVYFLTQKLLPLMNDGGRIVNISAGSARISLPGSSAYAARLSSGSIGGDHRADVVRAPACPSAVISAMRLMILGLSGRISPLKFVSIPPGAYQVLARPPTAYLLKSFKVLNREKCEDGPLPLS